MPLSGLAALIERRRASQAEAVPWWPVVLPLALIVASDYKLRSRPPGASLGGGADLTVLIEIAVYGTVAIFLYWRFGIRPPTRRISGLMFAAWAWAGYLALTAVWSPYPTIGVVRATQLLIAVAVCQVLATRATPADLNRLAHAFIALVVVSVAIGVARPFPRTHLTQDRFNWLYVHPVTAGVYLGAAVVLVTAFMIRRQSALSRALAHDGPRPWPLPVYLICLVTLAVALAATGTRGAALGTVVGLGILLASANGPRGRVDLLVTGVAVALIVLLAFSNAVLSFATRGADAESLETLNSRTDLWNLAFEKVAEEPIFGYGLGASRGLFLRALGLGGGHNAFVNALVDNGVVGLIVFVGLLLTLGTVLVSLVRRRHNRADAGLLLGLLGFFVTDAITMEGLATPANVAGTWLFLMVAWTEVLRRDRSGGLAGNPPAAQPQHAADAADSGQRHQ